MLVNKMFSFGTNLEKELAEMLGIKLKTNRNLVFIGQSVF